MANFTAHQDVECVYPISGQYGTGPRILYYALLLFVVIFRRQTWIAAGAAAYCLIYGGSAAIHALILAPILALGHPPIPGGTVQLPDLTNIPLNPVVTDLDRDSTLAVVGTGFLVVVPMALWSAHFHHSGAVPVLILWIILMFLGMICCIVVVYGVNGSSTGPLKEWRFCTPGYNDSMPFSGIPAIMLNRSWNDTIWNYFMSQNPQNPSCFYPCLNAKELLRSQGDVHIVKFLDLEPPNPLYSGMNIISAIIYGCVPLTILFTIAISILRIQGHRKSTQWDFSFPKNYSKPSIRDLIIWAVNVYGKILIPFVLAFFLIWVEWIISYDLQSESMQMVGQWAPLVGAGLVFVSAVVGRYWEDMLDLWEKFWRRRTKLKRDGEDEKIWRSIIYAWEEKKSHSQVAWN